MRIATRWIFFLHRYVGIGLCIPMLMWCLSGMVMMYVPYPSLSAAARLNGLAPLDWHSCCVLPDEDAPQHFAIEMMHGRLVLQDGGAPLDLGTGQRLERISAQDARAVALDFANGNGIVAGAVQMETIASDQWTVSGEFRRDQPLYRVGLGDAARTHLYVSGSSGRVVQSVTAAQRFWSYLGAVPHWLYFKDLRARPALWTQVVIWTSLTGGFLTIAGLYIGIRQWLKARRLRRWSPYRGFTWWHHVPGLVFGLFLLTWVFSGFLSVNPWGLLEGGGGEAFAGLSGPSVTTDQFDAALDTLSTVEADTGLVSLIAAPLDGTLYFIATASDGTRRRLDAAGRTAPLDAADTAFIARTLVADAGEKPTLLAKGDDYYFSYEDQMARLPVWRFIGADGDRYYVDPLSGMPAAAFDATGRHYRWLFQGLHRLDFVALLRARPLWDVVMLLLLGGAGAVAGTGLYLGLRYLRRLGVRRPTRR